MYRHPIVLGAAAGILLLIVFGGNGIRAQDKTDEPFDFKGSLWTLFENEDDIFELYGFSDPTFGRLDGVVDGESLRAFLVCLEHFQNELPKLHPGLFDQAQDLDRWRVGFLLSQSRLRVVFSPKYVAKGGPVVRYLVSRHSVEIVEYTLAK